MTTATRIGRILGALGAVIPAPWGLLVTGVGVVVASGDDEGLTALESQLAALPREGAMDDARAAALAEALAARGPA